MFIGESHDWLVNYISVLPSSCRQLPEIDSHSSTASGSGGSHRDTRSSNALCQLVLLVDAHGNASVSQYCNGTLIIHPTVHIRIRSAFCLLLQIDAASMRSFATDPKVMRAGARAGNRDNSR